MVDVTGQIKYGLCGVLKHSADCRTIDDGDIFRKKAKETRQKVALEQPGV